MNKRKQDLFEMFPPVTREYVTQQKQAILSAPHLSNQKKIRSLELLKVEILASHNPVKYFRGFKKFCKAN